MSRSVCILALGWINLVVVELLLDFGDPSVVLLYDWRYNVTAKRSIFEVGRRIGKLLVHEQIGARFVVNLINPACPPFIF
jgi:hypothetical protein